MTSTSHFLVSTHKKKLAQKEDGNVAEHIRNDPSNKGDATFTYAVNTAGLGMNDAITVDYGDSADYGLRITVTGLRDYGDSAFY